MTGERMHAYLVVFVGAGLGGALRHGVNVVTLRLLDSTFPYGTLFVNVVGSLAMGLFVGFFAAKTDPGQMWRLFLTTGILGGFTTFSAFSFDALVLYERGEFALCLLYVLASLGASVAALFAGLMVMRSL